VLVITTCVYLDVYHPLPILLSCVVLFCGFLGLTLLFTAIYLTLVDYFVVPYESVTYVCNVCNVCNVCVSARACVSVRGGQKDLALAP
jgi:hypothetical protein